MKKNSKKITIIILTIISIISIGVSSYAHSGRTDANGGHRDSKNKSGLGSYHYHCGGHPAHLHTNGVCPYSSSSTSNKKGTSESTSSNTQATSDSSASNTQETSATPTVIEVEDIRINEDVATMEEGEKQNLTATVTPYNATDKNIVWKSSDESIVTVSATGEIFAKKYGTVEITATSSNGKSSTIKINVKEPEKVENNLENEPSHNIQNENTTNINNESNPVAGILTLGMLGGIGYLGYDKFKRR